MVVRFSILALCAIVSSFVAGAVEVVDPRDLSPGDEGVCVTEVEGGALLEIPIRVLGVMGPNGPEDEIIVIRLEHERFEEVGVAAGMSGSPVYIQGRLLGALAFGWQFASEPIAGVTPFVHMQNLAADGVEQVAASAGWRPPIETILQAQAEGRLPQAVLDWMAPEGGRGSRSLPLAVGGLGMGVSDLDWPSAAWRRMGWMVSPAVGGTEEGNPGPVHPGSMVAVVLVDGDAHMAAGGTVTEVRDGTVWAFGHPFLAGGAIRLPLARASVVTILPSLASSFKMFNVGPVIGSVTEDRAHGVLAEFGDPPALVPLEVATPETVYKFEVVKHPLLRPLLSGFMVYASHAARGRSFGLQTIAVGLEVEFVDGRSLTLDQSFEGGDAPAQCAAWTSAVLGYLAASPFAPVDVQSVAVAIDSRDGLHGASVLDVIPTRRVVAPGERVGVRVRLMRDGGRVETVDLGIEVPSGTAEGRLDLIVADGASWTAYDLGARPMKQASFDDELRLLQRLESSRNIVVALEKQGASVVLPGGTTAAPAGFIASLQSGLGDELTTASYRLVARADTQTSGPVLGATRIRLEVRRRVEWDGVN